MSTKEDTSWAWQLIPVTGILVAGAGRMPQILGQPGPQREALSLMAIDSVGVPHS